MRVCNSGVNHIMFWEFDEATSTLTSQGGKSNNDRMWSEGGRGWSAPFRLSVLKWEDGDRWFHIGAFGSTTQQDVLHVAYVPTGQVLAAGPNGAITVYDDKLAVQEIPAHTASCNCLRPHPDGTSVLSVRDESRRERLRRMSETCLPSP